MFGTDVGKVVLLGKAPNMLLVPYLQIRANSIYSYTVNEDRSYGRSIQSLLTENLRLQKTYGGTLTVGGKKRLTKAIDFMVSINKPREIFNPVTRRKQPFQIGFVTLTIYSTDRKIKGKEAHKTCLEPFIKWMRQTHGVKSYIWKAELQKRGQIHYHIMIDQFIHWKALRKKWNELQQRSGYLDTFYNKFGHWDANSVDVHSVKKQRNLSFYLVKEVAKAFQNDKELGGKIWDCSLNIKKAKYFTVVENFAYSYFDQMIAQKEIRVIPTDHCYIYEFLKQSPTIILSPENMQAYSSYMDTVRNYERQPEIKTPVCNKVKEVMQRPNVPVTFNRQKQLSLSRYTRPGLMNVLIEPHLFGSS